MAGCLKSPKYLKFIRNLNCIVTGNPNPIAHHIRTKTNAGAGMKPSDYWCVPLCPIEHRKLHDMGEMRYWKENNLCPFTLVAMLNIRYIKAHVESDGGSEDLCNKLMEVL